jgi:hypothetical protein
VVVFDRESYPCDSIILWSGFGCKVLFVALSLSFSTLGTRRAFDRRFQRRMEELEDWLILLLIVISKHFARDYDGKSGGHLVKDVLDGDFPQMAEAAREMLRKSLQSSQ